MITSTLASMNKGSFVSKHRLFRYSATLCQQKVAATNLKPTQVPSFGCREGRCFIWVKQLKLYSLDLIGQNYVFWLVIMEPLWTVTKDTNENMAPQVWLDQSH